MEEEEKEIIKEDEAKELAKLKTTVQGLSVHLEKLRSEYVELFKKPRKFIWMNLFLGIVRGVGMFIGLAVVGAIIVSIGTIILGKMETIPVLGKFIAKLLKAVEEARTAIGK